MITLYRPSGYDSPRASSFAGRSIDDKPLDAENGSSFKEIDTGRVFRYDKENNIWIEQKSTSGGGGATEPYIEETYDADGNLIGAKMYGYAKVRDFLFAGCSNLALTSLPAGVTSISDYAFYGCTSLTSIIFKGTPTTIHPSAFRNCTNLTDIKVPWSEGAVSGAPWSATNATITYNYTE